MWFRYRLLQRRTLNKSETHDSAVANRCSRHGSRINTDQFPKRTTKVQASNKVWGRAPSINFLDLYSSLKSPFQGFRVIQTGFQLGKCFFIIKNIFIMKNLTGFHKKVETGVDPRLCAQWPSTHCIYPSQKEVAINTHQKGWIKLKAPSDHI